MKRAIILLMMCALAGAQDKPSAKAATRSFEVSGTLYNAVTGEPLSRAKVTLMPTREDVDLDAAQAGPTRGPGGAGAGGRRRFIGGQQGEERAPTTLQQSMDTMTDGNGRFVFAGVAAGKYSLAAMKRNFPRQMLEQHGQFSTAVVTGEGKKSTGIAFRISPDSGISGRVTDDFGDAVRNAQVMLFYKSPDSGEEAVRRRGGTSTDQQGDYHFSHLTPGTYYLVVSAQPWYMMYARMMPQLQDASAPKEEGDANLDVAYPLTFFSGASDETEATPINLKTGEHYVADMLLNTVPAMHVKIANTDPATPIQPMVTAQAFGQDVFMNPMMMRVGRGAQGGMEIALPPGHYDVALRSFAMAERGNGPPPVISKQAIDVSGDTQIDASRPSEAAAVTGSVKFEGAGDQTPRGQLIFRKKDTGEIVFGRTSDDGQLQNVQLMPGKYVVSAAFSQWLMKNVSATGARVIGRTMEVAGTGPISVLVTMSREVGRVDGFVKSSESEQGISGAMVVLVPEDEVNDQPLFRRFQSDSDGSFAFTNVVPGQYTVIALTKGWELEWGKPAVLKDYLPDGEVVKVTPAGRVKVTVKPQ